MAWLKSHMEELKLFRKHYGYMYRTRNTGRCKRSIKRSVKYLHRREVMKSRDNKRHGIPF